MLELNKLMLQVDAMSENIAKRQIEYKELIAKARQALTQFDQVDDALHHKINLAKKEDSSWRGARPCDDRLTARFIPETDEEDATLIGVDGSQIYPNRHGPALYYLINTGVIVLRQGSGEAPVVATDPQLHFEEADLYDDGQNLLGSDDVNDLRELAEIRALAAWAQQERTHWQSDRHRLILALTDGPLLIWMSEKEKEQAARRRVQDYLQQLQVIQQSGGIPIGYVARPRSANVVRLLHVAQLADNEISKTTVRANRYRALTDATLFNDLSPNQRTALFTSTAEVNQIFARDGQEICFFYVNISHNSHTPHLARVDVPRWAAEQPGMLDRIHRALYRDADGTDYPYVLIRAHELALVTHQERLSFEEMLNVAVLRHTGVLPTSSTKETLKNYF